MRPCAEFFAGHAAPQTTVIAPSMLKCDFSQLLAEVRRLEAGGAEVLHWDVMDGHFVPNLSYGALVLERLRKATSLFFDAHLMISDPGKYLADYLNVGCDAITIHIEAVSDPRAILRQIRDAGRVAGLALNPDTPVSAIEPYLEDCGLVLVMSVQPGFGGQKFLPVALEKLRALAQRVRPGTVLSVDGGIGSETIAAAASAGARLFVAGSAIFDMADYRTALVDLRNKAMSGLAEH